MNAEGMVVLLNYREDGVTPFFVFFKDGLVAEKCVRIACLPRRLMSAVIGGVPFVFRFGVLIFLLGIHYVVVVHA